MRRTLLAIAAAAAFLVTGCKIDAPAGDLAGGIEKLDALMLTSAVRCRDPKGRYAKCQTCPDGTKIWVGATCPPPPPPPPPSNPCPAGSVLGPDGHCTAVQPPPAPIPDPAPPPPPSTGWEASPSLSGSAPINSIAPGTGLAQNASIPKSAAPDVVGAFRFICLAGQVLRDDPIVFPGQPGKSHLHQFYGNKDAKATSTYASLRGGGESTCGFPLNRSSYWMPAMLDGLGNVVRPDYVSIYYKRRPKTDPLCNRLPGAAWGVQGICVNLPNNLKFIFGYDMLTGKSPTGFLWFNCQGTGSVPGKYKTIPEAAAKCPAGAQLGAIIEAPDCWDGKNLDSPNHRDHVAYAGYGDWGYLKCPDSHPYVIPTFTLGAWFPASATTPNWRLSSDDMVPGAPAGTMFHADFWMAWEPWAHQLWEDNCLDKMLNCSAGELGNGQSIFEAWARAAAQPTLIPVSTIP